MPQQIRQPNILNIPNKYVCNSFALRLQICCPITDHDDGLVTESFLNIKAPDFDANISIISAYLVRGNVQIVRYANLDVPQSSRLSSRL